MDSINKLRTEIDTINLDLCKLLIERKRIVECIGNEKRNLGINIYDRNRESKIFDMLKQKYSLDEFNYLEPIFKEIIKTSRQVQLEYK